MEKEVLFDSVPFLKNVDLKGEFEWPVTLQIDEHELIGIVYRKSDNIIRISGKFGESLQFSSLKQSDEHPGFSLKVVDGNLLHPSQYAPFKLLDCHVRPYLGMGTWGLGTARICIEDCDPSLHFLGVKLAFDDSTEQMMLGNHSLKEQSVRHKTTQLEQVTGDRKIQAGSYTARLLDQPNVTLIYSKASFKNQFFSDNENVLEKLAECFENIFDENEEAKLFGTRNESGLTLELTSDNGCALHRILSDVKSLLRFLSHVRGRSVGIKRLLPTDGQTYFKMTVSEGEVFAADNAAQEKVPINAMLGLKGGSDYDELFKLFGFWLKCEQDSNYAFIFQALDLISIKRDAPNAQFASQGDYLVIINAIEQLTAQPTNDLWQAPTSFRRLVKDTWWSELETKCIETLSIEGRSPEDPIKEIKDLRNKIGHPTKLKAWQKTAIYDELIINQLFWIASFIFLKFTFCHFGFQYNKKKEIYFKKIWERKCTFRYFQFK